MNIFKSFLTKSEGKKTVFDPYGDTNARWYTLKNNEDYATAFKEIPELNSIVTNKSKQLSKGIWRCKDLKTDELIEDDKFLDILKRPNPIMGGGEWLESMYVDWQVFGNAYNFFLTPSTQTPTPDNVAAIYNLQARYTYPQATGKVFYQTKIEDIISKYVLLIRGKQNDFKTKHICHISNATIDFLNGQYVVGESPLQALNWALSNIKAAYEARNVYITRRGAFGILTNNSKGDMGVEPIPEKDQLQKDLNKYGLTKKQWQIILTNADLKWNPISIPTKDLELYKEVKESTIAIAQAYSYPILLMGYMEGSTFSNLESEYKRLYSDAILPDAKHISEEVSRTVNAAEFNKEYFLDFSHIEAIQADKKVEAERQDIAVKTILELNRSVQLGEISYEAAINVLTFTVGMTDEEAKEILSVQNVKKEIE